MNLNLSAGYLCCLGSWAACVVWEGASLVCLSLPLHKQADGRLALNLGAKVLLYLLLWDSYHTQAHHIANPHMGKGGSSFPLWIGDGDVSIREDEWLCLK